MANDRFVYVTFIRTTPEKLWEALLKPEFTKQYWFGVTLDSDWKKGCAMEDGVLRTATSAMSARSWKSRSRSGSS